MRLNNTVNGKRISAPAGYDSFDNTKKQVTRNSQVAQGDREEITIGKNEKVDTLKEIVRIVRDYKEKGIPLPEDEVRVFKAEPNNRTNETVR